MRLTVCCSATRIGRMTLQYSNLPERYVRRAMEKGHIGWKTPRAPQYQPREVKKRRFYFGVERCWTDEFHRLNRSDQPKVFLRPMGEWSMFRGDIVQVLTGRDRGKQGTVVQIIEERQWVMVEGLNCEYVMRGQTDDYPGHMTRVERPLLVGEEVTLVDPSDDKPCQVEWRYTDDGERVRVSTRTGRVIPTPQQALETYDYKLAHLYKESEKDTPVAAMQVATFRPALKTFQMEIAESMKLSTDGQPERSYWY